MTGRIAGLLPFSAVDGPGNRSVVFLQGCNIRCRYCHNPETIDPSGGEEWTLERVLAELERAQPFTSGVTISGGECTLQFPFLRSLLQALKAQPVPRHVLIDTNGLVTPQRLRQLLVLVDGLMVDLKAADPGEHRLLTGSSNELILQTIRAAAQAHKLAELRTVISPGAFDAAGTVQTGAQLIAELSPRTPYALLRYRPHGVRNGETLAVPDDKLMQDLAALARAEGCTTVVIR